MNTKISNIIILVILMIGICAADGMTESDALDSINSAKMEIALMEESGLSTNYVNDQLTEANNLIQQLDYVSILKNGSSSTNERSEASQALRLINYNSLSYEDILIHTHNIKDAKKSAFNLADEIVIFELKIKNLERDGFNSSRGQEMLKQIYSSFNAERYSEVQGLITSGESIIEEIKSEESTANLLLDSSKNFFQKYSAWIILILIIFTTIGLSIRSKLKKSSLRKRIARLNNELKSLDILLKKTQNDRFKKATISGLVYNIRSENYKKRLENVRSEIPILEKRLEALNKVDKKPHKTKRERKINRQTKRIEKDKHKTSRIEKKSKRKKANKKNKTVKKAFKKRK